MLVTSPLLVFEGTLQGELDNQFALQPGFATDNHFVPCSYVNLCWVMGQFISAGALVEVNQLTGQWAYRVSNGVINKGNSKRLTDLACRHLLLRQIPFACQWILPPFLIVLISFAPESPWVLIRQGRYEQAEKVIARIKASTDKVSPADTVAMMRRTNDFELANNIQGSYWDCFKGVDLRRTEVSRLTDFYRSAPI